MSTYSKNIRCDLRSRTCGRLYESVSVITHRSCPVSSNVTLPLLLSPVVLSHATSLPSTYRAPKKHMSTANSQKTTQHVNKGSVQVKLLYMHIVSTTVQQHDYIVRSIMPLLFFSFFFSVFPSPIPAPAPPRLLAP